MLDFLIRHTVGAQAQKQIECLEPKVNVHIPKDLPLPSIGLIRQASAVASKINALEPQMSQASDEELKRKTPELKARIQQALAGLQEDLQRLEDQYHKAPTPEARDELLDEINRAQTELKKAREEVLNSILPEAFALVREVGKRLLNMRHFDIQLVGGMMLHQGKIAEMTTGEGKTLVATLPAYLNAMAGLGVHVVTVNDYLARRDREWMGPIYEFLGLSVGVIQHDLSAEERRLAYHCDITYGTNNEFGFDYLRDNMVIFKEEMVQRGHQYAIVDEVDSILIDEARTPLIISGPAEESTDKYYKAKAIADQIKGKRITEKEEIEAKYKNEDIYQGFDYIADEKARSVALSEDGEQKVAKMFGVANLHDMETIEYRHHILQALKAKEFFRRDVEYVVRDGQVIIVDEFTGRMMPGRRWSDGLHQAVEAREGIKIERENQTLATITFQNYFRMYGKLAGMTGTAYTEAAEFKQIYNLDTVVMPTNKILKRTNYPDCIYKTFKEKFKAVVKEIEELHAKGQPVLVGTISIEKSEILSSMLKARGIPHQVLNAKYHDLEAQIIAQAGRYKAVTIATNMAGRGTDIMLGGNAEFLAKSLLSQKAQDLQDPQAQEAMLKKFLEQFRMQVKEEHEKVVAVGGLHVLGTERHESRRIDNQLRGRSGRQGDPGSSRFYVSLEDDLMRLFGSDRIMLIMDRLGMEEDQVIEHPMVSGAIEVAQKRVENHNFEIRKHLLEYDDVMNKQREAIYGLRRVILNGEEVKDRILTAMQETVRSVVAQYLYPTEPTQGQADFEGLAVYLWTKFGLDLGADREKLEQMEQAQVEEFFIEALTALYENREKEIGSEPLRHMERIFFLHIIDAKWKDHLYAMDYLKEGISFRAYAQRDPLIEFKREGFAMFQMMFDSINQEVAETILKIQPLRGPEEGGEPGTRPVRPPSPRGPKGVFDVIPKKLVHDEYSSLQGGLGGPAAPAGVAGPGPAAAPQPPAPQPYHKEGPKVGRNDPCPCGSGKKYKKCHGA